MSPGAAPPPREPAARPHTDPAHLAIDAHAPAPVDAVLVLAGVAPVHLRVVVAVVGVAMAVAGWRVGAQLSAHLRDPTRLGPLGHVPQATGDPKRGLARDRTCHAARVPTARV